MDWQEELSTNGPPGAQKSKSCVFRSKFLHTAIPWSVSPLTKPIDQAPDRCSQTASERPPTIDTTTTRFWARPPHVWQTRCGVGLVFLAGGCEVSGLGTEFKRLPDQKNSNFGKRFTVCLWLRQSFRLSWQACHHTLWLPPSWSVLGHLQHQHCKQKIFIFSYGLHMSSSFRVKNSKLMQLGYKGFLVNAKQNTAKLYCC